MRNSRLNGLFVLVIFLAIGLFCISVSSFAGVNINRALSTHETLRIELTGPINKDTLVSIQKMVAELQGKNVWVSLESNGGDWEAAMAIGRQLRKISSIAQVHSDKECSSACALILAGAQIRLVSDRARIGIHRPYSASTRPLTLEESQRRYRSLEVATRAYLREMNLPEALFDAMVRVPPERIRILTAQEIQDFGLEGQDPAHSEVGDAANARALGLDKQEYLARKARAESTCTHLAQRATRMVEQLTKQMQDGRKASKTDDDAVLKIFGDWQDCRDGVMRGKR